MSDGTPHELMLIDSQSDGCFPLQSEIAVQDFGMNTTVSGYPTPPRKPRGDAARLRAKSRARFAEVSRSSRGDNPARVEVGLR